MVKKQVKFLWLFILSLSLIFSIGCVFQFQTTKKKPAYTTRPAARPQTFQENKLYALEHVFFIVSAPKGTISSRKKVLVSIYKSDSIQSGELTSVPDGTHVRALEKRDNWYRIQLPNGTEGWMQGYYLEKEQE